MNFRELQGLVAAQNEGLFQSNQKVAVAMSGGADSTALFHVFCEFLKLKKIFNLMVLHVNFDLRGDESEGDFRFCRDLAAEKQVPFRMLDCRVETPENRRLPHESVQVWARRVRHAWFARFCEEGYSIALGHTLNDVAENVLFRLARGARPENLAGMSRMDAPIWRPLIAIERNDLVKALTSAGFTWREDSSNLSRKYARNRIRHDVLSVMESISTGATKRIAMHGLELAERGRIYQEEQEIQELAAAMSAPNRSRQKVENVSDFLKVGMPGQSIDVGDGFVLVRKSKTDSQNDGSLPLSAKAVQHQQGLDAPQVEAVLPAGSCLYVPTPAIYAGHLGTALSQIEIFGQNDQQSIEVSVKPPKSEDMVTFAQSTTTFKFKDLMQKWKIAVANRIRYVGVSTTKKAGIQIVSLFQSDTDLDGAPHG